MLIHFFHDGAKGKIKMYFGMSKVNKQLSGKSSIANWRISVLFFFFFFFFFIKTRTLVFFAKIESVNAISFIYQKIKE